MDKAYCHDRRSDQPDVEPDSCDSLRVFRRSIIAGELIDLVGRILFNNETMTTFRCAGRVFVMVSVAIYIAPVHHARCS